MMQGENNFHKRFLDCIINFRFQKMLVFTQNLKIVTLQK